MTAPAPLRRPAVELTADAGFSRRIRRLVVVSVIALGLIAVLATQTAASAPVIAMLVIGWILMPTLLAASLRRPGLRYLLVVPAALTGCALSVLCMTALPETWDDRAGWYLITVGVWMGAVLGSWLWYRWLPVPARLQDPFGRGRWTLAGIHAGVIVVGLVLVAL